MPKTDTFFAPAENRTERVLVLAPIGRDAQMTARFLSETGMASRVCSDSETLCRELEMGCGLIFLTGEALVPETLKNLIECLRQQPPWSDVPLLVLTSGGGETPINADALAVLGEAGNVTLIERPVRAATLLSSIKSALRARRRQYEVRDYLIEQTRAKVALEQSEERLRIALDAAQLGAWQLDIASGALDFTPRCSANFGLSPETETTYEMLFTTLHPDDRERVRLSIEEAIRGHTDYRCEFRVFWPDGSEHWILAMGRAHYRNENQPYRMVGVTADVTSQKYSEREREELLTREQAARAEAESANKLKDEFLATVSHELRTPLMAILGWTSLLRTGQLEERMVADALATVERNAHSQAQLINDLLDVSRITRGQLRLHIHPIELAQIIEAAVDTVRPSAEAAGITFELSLDSAASRISGDPDRLQQVVWNLLTNAIKFTPPGGHVRVCLQRVDSQVEISVADSGKGIAPQFLPDVFDRFRQADQTSTRRYGGLGLGLSIVWQLVGLHGGTVEAQSEGEGKGSTFIVRLPIIATPQGDEDQDTLPATNGNSSPLKETATNGTTPNGAIPDDLTRLDNISVLVVEDEDDAREVLRALFQHCGSEIMVAASAAEALRVLETWQPDILVSDVGLPDIDGYEFIARVRALKAERGSELPAIALTAFAKSADRERALQAGFQVHISKPVEPAELTAVVARLVNDRSTPA